MSVVFRSLWAGSVFALLCGVSFAVAQDTKPDPARTQRWQDRDTPKVVETADRAFLDLLNLNPTTWRAVPAMAHVIELAKADRPTEAVDAFSPYFLNKLAQDHREKKQADPDRDQVLKAADALLNNTMVVGNKEVSLGEPGQVNWNAVDGPADQQRFGANMSLHLLSGFFPLAQAYQITGDKKYLDKFLAFLDDWQMNDTYFDTIHPCDVSDNINSNAHAAQTVASLLARLATFGPVDQRPVLPARIVTQVIGKLYTQVVPLHLVYLRSNTHNWTPGAAMAETAAEFSPFAASGFYLREAVRRQIEDNAVTQNLRDGSENQQDPWYNANYPTIAEIFDALEEPSLTPGWDALRGDIEWKNEIREHLKERLTYQIHLRLPNGEWPIPFRGGDMRQGSVGAMFGDYSYNVSPEAYEDPVNAAILQAVNNPESNVKPPYTSDWFPYGGFNIVRDGWEHNSGYGAMFCSPQPGAYGGYRSRSNNNTFGMASNGQDLLVDDTTGHYMYPSSPLKVDEQNQFFHAGVYKVGPPASHKVYEVAAWTEPANWRWHSSDQFNLMEGVYAGPYTSKNKQEGVAGQYGLDQSMEGTVRLDQTVHDVTHQRLAMYLRGPKLWIVTDRLHSPAEHEYEQEWNLPIQPGPPAFAPDQIDVDANARTIRTFADRPAKPDPDKVNHAATSDLSMYQFSTAKLDYGSKLIPAEKRYNRYLLYGRDDIEVKWQGTGDSQVVTAAFPRVVGSGAAGDLKDVHQITSGQAGVGFSAVAPDGSAISYLSSPKTSDDLTIDDVRLAGTALLICGNAGMALDCSQLTVAGKTVEGVPSDFEFKIADHAVSEIVPIYRPIDPVTIGPATTAFSDEVEVTLSSRTPGVEIRYTTDGGEPTPQSTLYAGPFKLDHSATVRTRAYRPGVTHNPYETSGTEATPISFAVFDRRELAPAVTPPRPTAGINVSYYEGDWRQMLLAIDKLKPVKTATADSLWDLSVIPQDNPPIDGHPNQRSKCFALVYSGYLKIPESGVYTLEAPREFVYPDIQAGYELRVYLGNHLNNLHRVDGLSEWYPSTRLHAFGNWSVPLAKGLQPFKIVYIDWRTDAAKRLNVPGLNDYVWNGVTPDLKIFGPHLDAQPIPAAWLMR